MKYHQLIGTHRLTLTQGHQSHFKVTQVKVTWEPTGLVTLTQCHQSRWFPGDPRDLALRVTLNCNLGL